MRGLRAAGVILAAALATSGSAARADEAALQALGLGLSILNNLQQQQQQAQPQQVRPQRQQQATVRRSQPQQPPASVAAPVDTEAVAQAQALLNRLGYDAGPVDGAPGRRTRTAIAQFRAAYGLAPGTDVDPELLGALQVAGRSAPAVAAGGKSLTKPGAEPTPPYPGLATAEAPAAATPEAPAPATTKSGILTMGGRVVGMLAGSTEATRQIAAAFPGTDLTVNLRRVVFADTLLAIPDLLADDAQALNALEMMEPALAKDILEQGLHRPLSRAEAQEVDQGYVQERLFRSLDPFQQQAVLAAVRANAGRVAVPDAPPAPIPVTLFCAIRLMPYDFDSRSFTNLSSDCDGVPFGIGKVTTRGARVEPEQIAMSPEEAQAFQPGSDAKDYLAAFDATLAIAAGPDGAPALTLSGRTGLHLLAPGSLTEAIYSFGTRDAGGQVEAPTLQDGVYRVDGRLAAMAAGDTQGHGFDLDGNAFEKALHDLASAYGRKLGPQGTEQDEDVLAALRTLPPATTRAIVEAALRRPLSKLEASQLQTYGETGNLLASPFARKRAADAARAVLAEADGTLPELPLQLRVYCTVELGDYDFAAGGFSVARSDCDQGVRGVAPLAYDGASPVPAQVAIPPDEAETLGEENGTALLASYDADLDFKVRKTESDAQVSAVLLNRTGLRLYGKGDPGRVVWTAPAAGGTPAAAADAVEPAATPAATPWHLVGSDTDRAALTALAGAAEAFPADGPALLAAGGPSLGSIEATVPIYGDGQGGTAPAPLFQTLGEGPEVDALAAALGVPASYLVALGGQASGSGLEGIYGLLPAPAARYVATAPADLYGQRSIEYRWSADVTGVHRFALPGGGELTLAAINPVVGAFVTENEGKVLEHFDITASEPPAKADLIVPETRAAIALGQAGGADPVALLTEKLDGRLSVFDRTDLARRLVAADAPVTSFWVEGRLSLGEYDMARQAFPVTTVALAPIEVLRAEDLRAGAISLYLTADEMQIPMPEDAARQWLAANPDGGMRIRARFRVDRANVLPGGVMAYGSLTGVEVLAPDAVVTRRDPGAVVLALADAPGAAAEPAAAQPAAEAVAPVADAAPAAPAAARDILGIAVGTPLAEAEAKVAATLGATTRYTLSRPLYPERVGVTGVPAWASFATASLYRSDASRVSIALFSEPPAAADQVTGILRTQSFAGAGRPHPDAILGILNDKYGPPSRDESGSGVRLLLWSAAAASSSRCENDLYGQARAAEGHLPVQQVGEWPLLWYDEAGTPWADADSRTLDLRNLFAQEASCTDLGPAVVAIILTDPDGMVRSLQLALGDPGAAGGWEKANEAAAKGAAPAPGAALDVKL